MNSLKQEDTTVYSCVGSPLINKSLDEILELIKMEIVVPGISGIVKKSENKNGVRIIEEFELEAISIIPKCDAVDKNAKFLKEIK